MVTTARAKNRRSVPSSCRTTMSDAASSTSQWRNRPVRRPPTPMRTCWAVSKDDKGPMSTGSEGMETVPTFRMENFPSAGARLAGSTHEENFPDYNSRLGRSGCGNRWGRAGWTWRHSAYKSPPPRWRYTAGRQCNVVNLRRCCKLVTCVLYARRNKRSAEKHRHKNSQFPHFNSLFTHNSTDVFTAAVEQSPTSSTGILPQLHGVQTPAVNIF